MSQTPLFDQLKSEFAAAGKQYENLIIPIPVEKKGMVVPQKMDGAKPVYVVQDEAFRAQDETQPMLIGDIMKEMLDQFYAQHPNGIVTGFGEVQRNEDGSMTVEVEGLEPKMPDTITVKPLHQKDEANPQE